MNDRIETGSDRICLKDWFTIIFSKPFFGELMQEGLDVRTKRGEALANYYSLIEGLQVLQEGDPANMEKFISETKDTIRGEPRHCILDYLRKIRRKLGVVIERYREIRERMQGEENAFAFNSDVEHTASKKYMAAFIDILSRLIGDYEKLSNAIDNPEVATLVSQEEIEYEYEKLMMTLNDIRTLEVLCKRGEDLRGTLFDRFQVSPFDMDDLAMIFARVSENRAQPDLDHLEMEMDSVLMEKFSQRYSTPVEAMQVVVGDDIQQAFDNCVKSPKYPEIHRFSSCIELLQEGHSTEAEAQYREILFLQEKDEHHDFVNENRSYEIWRQLRQMISSPTDDSPKELRRLCGELLNLIPGVARAQDRSMVQVRAAVPCKKKLAIGDGK
ncbi:hypothetical protein ACFL2V_17580 [Pseudomonadota bacterium]